MLGTLACWLGHTVDLRVTGAYGDDVPKAQRESVRFEFDADKAIAVIAYLASKPDEVTSLDKYKAGKLIFLLDKYHLVRYGRPVVGGEYRALQWGPVPQDPIDLLHEVTAKTAPANLSGAAQFLLGSVEVDKRWKYPRLSAKAATNLEALSRSEIMALDRIISLHGRKSFAELKALTHEMPAFRVPWASKDEDDNVAPMRYEDFFEEDTDAIEGAYEEMIENAELQSRFPAPNEI